MCKPSIRNEMFQTVLNNKSHTFYILMLTLLWLWLAKHNLHNSYRQILTTAVWVHPTGAQPLSCFNLSLKLVNIFCLFHLNIMQQRYKWSKCHAVSYIKTTRLLTCAMHVLWFLNFQLHFGIKLNNACSVLTVFKWDTV